jgi:hypothetical protein
MPMIVTIKESLQRIKPDEVLQAEWNGAVRKGLIAGAEWLIETNLRKRKFRPGNRARYNFRPRGAKYENYKRFARKIRDPETGLKVTPAKPAVDLVYTGTLRDFIEGKPASAYRKIPTATSNRVRVRVPIPGPPRVMKKGGGMKQEQWEELGAFSQDEYIQVRRIVIAVVAQEMGFGDASEADLWRRAG